MSEEPEEKAQQPETPTKGSTRKPWLVIGVVAAIAVLVVAGINTGWLTALSGNGEEAPPLVEPSSPPEILSITAATDRITPLSSTALHCDALDPEGLDLSYDWSASGGEILGEGASVEWRAPDTEGLYRVFVSVDNLQGGSAQDSLALRVRYNQPPEILYMRSELGDDNDWVVPGARVLIQCEAEDLDGDALSYEWVATSGEIFGQGDAIIWIAPPSLGMQWITVTVEDTYGDVAQRSIPITVNEAQPPTIYGLNPTALDTDMFKPYGDSWRIFRERSVAIQARVDDDEGLYTYEWSAELGTITADGPNAVWVAPAAPKGWVNIVLQVSDRHGNKSSDTLRIFVETCPSCI